MSISKVSLAVASLLFAFLLSCSERERLALKAQAGNAAAMREYGNWICGKGHDNEYQEGMAWLRKAAEKGDTQAMYDYALGRSVGGDTVGECPEGLYWFRKGAEAGHRLCMIKLANAYEYGYLGLSKDPAEAAKWFEAARRAKKPGEM